MRTLYAEFMNPKLVFADPRHGLSGKAKTARRLAALNDRGAIGARTFESVRLHVSYQGTSQNSSVGSQNISNYRRTAECSQNRQTFVVFVRTKFY